MKNRDYLLTLSDSELANAIIEIRFMNQKQLKEWLGHDRTATIRNFITTHDDGISYFKFYDYVCSSVSDFLEKYGTINSNILDERVVDSFNHVVNTYFLSVR